VNRTAVPGLRNAPHAVELALKSAIPVCPGTRAWLKGRKVGERDLFESHLRIEQVRQIIMDSSEMDPPPKSKSFI